MIATQHPLNENIKQKGYGFAYESAAFSWPKDYHHLMIVINSCHIVVILHY